MIFSRFCLAKYSSSFLLGFSSVGMSRQRRVPEIYVALWPRRTICQAKLLLPYPYAAVGGNCAHNRAARTELRLDPLAYQTLHCDREIDSHSSIGRACFEAGVVAARNEQVHTAIHGSEVEALSPPRISRQSGADSTIGRFPANITSDIGDADSAIDCLKIQRAFDGIRRDASVVGDSLEIRAPGNVDLVAY